MEKAVRQSSGHAVRSRRCIAALDLIGDLSFAENHRIERRRHREQMFDCVAGIFDIELSVGKIRDILTYKGESFARCVFYIIRRYIEFSPVAGGQVDCFADAAENEFSVKRGKPKRSSISWVVRIDKRRESVTMREELSASAKSTLFARQVRIAFDCTGKLLFSAKTHAKNKMQFPPICVTFLHYGCS